MLCTAPTLRTAAIGCRIQPTLFTPCTYTTSSVRSSDAAAPKTSRMPLAKRNVALQTTRSASTTAAQPSSVGTQPAAAATAAPSLEVLNWNNFFRLRRQRRFWQLGSSIGTGVNGFVGGAAALSNANVVGAICISLYYYPIWSMHSMQKDGPFNFFTNLWMHS